VQILQTVDNQNGPVAIGNLKTLINEQINGFVDFQVLAQYQPAMATILKQNKLTATDIVGAALPGSPAGWPRPLLEKRTESCPTIDRHERVNSRVRSRRFSGPRADHAVRVRSIR